MFQAPLSNAPQYHCCRLKKAGYLSPVEAYDHITSLGGLGSERMRSARLIVISAGNTGGFRTEFGLARDLVPPDQLLISFLPWAKRGREDRDRLYADFRAAFGPILPAQLPPRLGSTLFLVFYERWRSSSVAQLSRWWMLAGYWPLSRGGVQRAIRPALSQRAFRLASPPLERRLVFLGVLVVALTLMAVAGQRKLDRHGDSAKQQAERFRKLADSSKVEALNRDSTTH